MADPFTDLNIVSDVITIPTFNTVFRGDFPVNTPIPWATGDDSLRSLQILNFQLVPETQQDQVTSITGGAPGQWICLKTKTAGDEITFVHSVNLVMPFMSNLVLNDTTIIALFVHLGGNVYAKPV